MLLIQRGHRCVVGVREPFMLPTCPQLHDEYRQFLEQLQRLSLMQILTSSCISTVLSWEITMLIVLSVFRKESTNNNTCQMSSADRVNSRWRCLFVSSL